ncbi:MAG: START-like domain-containing protein [Flavobacteriales bacterium]
MKIVPKVAPITVAASTNGTSKKPVVVAKTVPTKPMEPAPVAVSPQVAKPAPAVATKTAVAAKPAPPPAPIVVKKPLKERVTIEFMVQSSPAVLYEMISSPSGFAEWYCTDVNVRGDQYTFIWPDEEEATTLIGRKLGEVIRFHRNDDDDEASYFEFRVRIDGMTNEVALIVTDHAWPAEVEETRNLWSSQIASLLRVLGA